MDNYKLPMATMKAILCAAATVTASGCASHDDRMQSEESSNPLTVSTDFTLTLTVADFGSAGPGDGAVTPTYEGGGGTSDWACDADCFDPDSAMLEVNGMTQDDVAAKDFRVCLQASDGRTAHTAAGAFRCTDWASRGTSTTGMATDADGFDPDSYRLRLDTRAWPDNVDQAREVKFRIRAWDKGSTSVYRAGPWTSYTATNAVGGGATGFTTGPLTRDPDGFEIEMNVAETSLLSFCSPGHRCQHGFGDCDTDNDCVSGSSCKHNAGAEFGYNDPGLDICVNGAQ